MRESVVGEFADFGRGSRGKVFNLSEVCFLRGGRRGRTYANSEYATLSDVTILVPEPASLSGLAIGGIALLARRRRASRWVWLSRREQLLN